MDNGPELWDKILTDVRGWFPNMKVVIAGGAVRDHRLGIEPKDIDVFINVEDELEFEFGLHDMDVRDLSLDNERYREGNSDMGTLIGVYETTIENCPYPVQIVGCRFSDGRDLIDKFDAEICTCFYDGEELCYSQAAQKDMADRTYTVRMDGPNRHKTTDRYWRFQNRIGNLFSFKLVDKFYEAEQVAMKKEYDRVMGTHYEGSSITTAATQYIKKTGLVFRNNIIL